MKTFLGSSRVRFHNATEKRKGTPRMLRALKTMLPDGSSDVEFRSVPDTRSTWEAHSLSRTKILERRTARLPADSPSAESVPCCCAASRFAGIYCAVRHRCLADHYPRRADLVKLTSRSPGDQSQFPNTPRHVRNRTRSRARRRARLSSRSRGIKIFWP